MSLGAELAQRRRQAQESGIRSVSHDVDRALTRIGADEHRADTTEQRHKPPLGRRLVTIESAGGWHLTTVEVDRIVGLLPFGLSAC